LLGFAVWRQVTGLTGQYEGALVQSQRQTAALRESEGRFRDLANALPQVVWTTYPDGNAAFLNQRWYDYTGLTPRAWRAGLDVADPPGRAAAGHRPLARGARGA
jgi:PAS domain-containing protein